MNKPSDIRYPPNLTLSERVVMSIAIDLAKGKASDLTISLDDIVKEFKDKSKPHHRSTINHFMSSVALKSYGYAATGGNDGWYLAKVRSVGRGNKAHYQWREFSLGLPEDEEGSV